MSNLQPLIKRLNPDDAERVQALIDERNQWQRLFRTAAAEAEQLRARLDGLGELRGEWRFDDGAGWFTMSRKPLSAADIRHLQKTTGRPVEHRLVGDWREVPDATADGHSGTETASQGVEAREDANWSARAARGPQGEGE